MGRETVLAPVTWNTGEWPVWTNVSGVMSGWTLPEVDTDIEGSGYAMRIFSFGLID